MSLRFHEIAEVSHRILNPISFEKAMLAGEFVRLKPGMRVLDLCSGKGEMLLQWAKAFGSGGHGVDHSHVFLAAAKARAEELGLAESVTFEFGEAQDWSSGEQFDVVSCIGATWIGGGLTGTLDILRRHLKPGGMMLVGEIYWAETPPPEYGALFPPEVCTLLPGVLDRIEAAGCDLVEMVLADGDSWDRYAAPQWLAVDDYLRANPADPEADELRSWISTARRQHLEHQRRYLGWGIFAIRVRD